jgi:hypothetical protein
LKRRKNGRALWHALHKSMPKETQLAVDVATVLVTKGAELAMQLEELAWLEWPAQKMPQRAHELTLMPRLFHRLSSFRGIEQKSFLQTEFKLYIECKPCAKAGRNWTRNITKKQHQQESFWFSTDPCPQTAIAALQRGAANRARRLPSPPLHFVDSLRPAHLL